MDGVSLASLLPQVRLACERLRDGLLRLFGDDLAALWVYGAAVSHEPPARLGDVDVHGVLTRSPSSAQAAGMEAMRREIESDLGAELDAWYIHLSAAHVSRTPSHLLSPHLVDYMWALHRCHLLSGRYVLLHGAQPRDVVNWPDWKEVLTALQHEIAWMEDRLHRVETEPFAPYVVLNCCRIAHTLTTHEAAVTKLESARWALASLPQQWREPVLAAVRWYDCLEQPGDDRLLRNSCAGLAAYVRRLIR